MKVRRSIPLGALVFAVALAVSALSVPAANSVQRDLDLGHANDALQSLNTFLGQNPSDAAAHNLRCRVYFQEQQWDPAIADCEAAVRLDPDNSGFHLWLGRAYGRKAEHASLVASYSLARKVHAEFQTAVQLNSRSIAALADLGEFDASAPLVVGGGTARAEAIVPQLQALDPAAALLLRSRIAESSRNFAQAEGDLKAAISVSSHPADAWMDLAAFYLRRGRIADMVAAAHAGAALDSRHGPALVDGASDLAQTGSETQTAIHWFQEYLESSAQSEVAPAFAVRAQLATLLERQGDTQAAQQQWATVHALASGYRPPAGTAPTRAGE